MVFGRPKEWCPAEVVVRTVERFSVDTVRQMVTNCRLHVGNGAIHLLADTESHQGLDINNPQPGVIT